MPPALLIINIPQPCSQNWEEMVPDGQGRHCSHCQKTVTDFTGWSDGDIYTFFAKNNGETCGRFLKTQVNRSIAIPYQPHSKLYRLFIAAGLVLMFTGVQEARGQSLVVPAVHQVMYTKPNVEYTGSIAGVVLDNVNQPIVSAIVSVYINDTLKGGTVSDIDGYYKIDNLPAGIYTLKFKNIDYEFVTIKNVTLSIDNNYIRNVIMNHSEEYKKNEKIVIGGKVLIKSDTSNKK